MADFRVGSQETIGADVILYVIAKGGQAAINKGGGDNPAVDDLPWRTDRDRTQHPAIIV